MRRFLITCKEFFCVLLVCACAGFAFALTRLPAFARGEGYEVYAAASSSAEISRTDTPLYFKLTRPTAGESVRYQGNYYESLKEYYSAELVFEEEAAGVHNYYLFSPKLGAPVDLGGKLINLHIAVSGEQTAVGTPLIFGGY